MMKNFNSLGLLAIGVLNLGVGLFVFSRPMSFYEATPGLSSMGPFSMHFIRDVGLAYFAGGTLQIAASVRSSRELGIAGSSWFVLHALFHLQIWILRGAPLDSLFFFELAAIQLPAFAALVLASNLSVRAIRGE